MTGISYKVFITSVWQPNFLMTMQARCRLERFTVTMTKAFKVILFGICILRKESREALLTTPSGTEGHRFKQQGCLHDPGTPTIYQSW